MLFALSLTAAACNVGKADAPSTASESAPRDQGKRSQRRVAVAVTASGYEPGAVEARAGEPLILVFKRTSDQGCGQEVVFPERDIRRTLPLNEEVEVRLTPRANETITFTCGMGMFRGSVVAAATPKHEHKRGDHGH
jgi:plastocyanin domain-containing protein